MKKSKRIIGDPRRWIRKAIGKPGHPGE